MLDETINNYKIEHPEELPALALAYIGDAVLELQVRMLLINLRVVKVNQLHKDTVKVVRAKNQAAVIHVIENELSEEEKSVVRRGRNAKSGRAPKNTDIIEYRHSTAFETLIGYLYLKGRHQRVNEIIKKAYEIANNK
jgi:ribonuclease III family protein